MESERSFPAFSKLSTSNSGDFQAEKPERDGEGVEYTVFRDWVRFDKAQKVIIDRLWAELPRKLVTLKLLRTDFRPHFDGRLIFRSQTKIVKALNHIIKFKPYCFVVETTICEVLQLVWTRAKDNRNITNYRKIHQRINDVLMNYEEGDECVNEQVAKLICTLNENDFDKRN